MFVIVYNNKTKSYVDSFR